MIFYGYIVDDDTLERTVKHKIEASCATEAYGKLEALREQWDDRLLLTDENGKIICESIDDGVGWLLDHYDKQHHVSLDDRLAKAVAQSDKESYRDAGDDWAQRRESLAAENLGFHG